MPNSPELTFQGYVPARDTELYCEVRGTGPTLVFIPGGGVDASHHAQAAALLADEFTTVCYDRRGYFRSRAPRGWTKTTVAEQVDDLAALIDHLDLGPATVWGSSLGGIIALDALIRRPRLLRSAVVHEPPLFAVLPDAPSPPPPAPVDNAREAMERHARQTLGESFDRLPQQHRERLLANGEVFLTVDAPGCGATVPSPDAVASALSTAAIPIHVLADPDHAEHPLRRTSQWVAEQAGTAVTDLPGGHMAYCLEPRATADATRALTAHQGHPG